jgi:hypothetical protein
VSKVRSNLIRIGGGIVILCLTFYYLSERQARADFVIRISGANGVRFNGHYALKSFGKSTAQNISGSVPAEYPVSGTQVSVFVQRTEGDGMLMVEISRDGTVVKIAGSDRGQDLITATSE